MNKLFVLFWLPFLYARVPNGYCFCFLHFLKYFSSTLKCFSFPQDFPLPYQSYKELFQDMVYNFVTSALIGGRGWGWEGRGN